MSYTKTNPQPAEINPGETAVTLDDGTIVAVSANVSPQPNGAPSAIQATARAIKSDGSPVMDPEGQSVQSVFSFTPTAEQANDQA